MQGLAAAGGAGNSGGVTVTDGTHTVTGSTKITFSGATVSGATPNSTVTVVGGGSIGPPGVATLGGVFSNVGAAHEWLSTINTDGSVTLTQPAFTDISGVAAPGQLPTFGTSVAGAVPASGGGTTNFLRADATWAAPPSGAISVDGTSGYTALIFTGAGVSVSGAAPTATMTITGGGGGGSIVTVGYSTNSSTSASTALSGADISGGSTEHTLAMTGAITAASNIQLPTVAALVTAMSGAIGQSYKLRVTNKGFAQWTVTTNTGWTLNGTMTIDAGSYLEFYVTLTSLTAAVLQMCL